MEATLTQKPDTKESVVSFNLNHSVFVQITDLGFRHWKKSEDDLLREAGLIEHSNTIEYYEAKADKNGYVKFQLWHFISIFGNVTNIGISTEYCPNVYFYEKEINS